MKNYKKVLYSKSFTFLAIIIFTLILIIFAILFNFKGTSRASAANHIAIGAKQEIIQKQIGYISKVYEKEGRRYLSFDEVEFLTGKEAVEAAKKDGKALFENGQFYVLDDYYIVNKNKGLKDYVIDNSASLSLLGLIVSTNGNDITNNAIDYERFKAAINNKNYPKLCYIYLKENVVTKVESQYVP